MIDLILILESNTSIKIYDNTNTSNIVNNINSWIINFQDLTGNKSCIKEPILHLQSGDRIDREVCIIEPVDFGTGTLIFTDGLYKVTYSINSESKVRYFILYPNIKTAFDTLIDSTNYTVDITPLGKIKYVGDTTDGDIYQIRMVSALIEQLNTYSNIEITSSSESSYLVIINDIITKLNRLLEI